MLHMLCEICYDQLSPVWSSNAFSMFVRPVLYPALRLNKASKRMEAKRLGRSITSVGQLVAVVPRNVNVQEKK